VARFGSQPLTSSQLGWVRSGSPVVLIAGENCGAFPGLRQLGVRYAVLGFYKITAARTELEPNLRPGHEGQDFVRWKVSGSVCRARSIVTILSQFHFAWVQSQSETWFANLIGSWGDGDLGQGDDPSFLTADGGSAPCEAGLFGVEMDPYRENISCFSPAYVNQTRSNLLSGGTLNCSRFLVVPAELLPRRRESS